MAELEAERRAIVRASQEAHSEKVRQLMHRKGSGINGAWLFVMACFGWRDLQNRRQVGSLAGLPPTPYQSGESTREQGITKAGKRRMRWMATAWAWGWGRYQPESALSRWFKDRFETGGKRLRRSGIVAVARQFLMALWRGLRTGV
jgi:transposase